MTRKVATVVQVVGRMQTETIHSDAMVSLCFDYLVLDIAFANSNCSCVVCAVKECLTQDTSQTISDECVGDNRN